jgi:uncharacterized protein (DUF302 family)
MGETKTLRYGLRAEVQLPYEIALERTRAALRDQGFGVLTEIDVKKTMKEKLGEDFRRYVILGACNPPLAHRALSAELDLGLLLPCNLVVYETGEGQSVVAAFDPVAGLAMADNAALGPIGHEVRRRMQRVLEAVQQAG